VKGKLLIAPRDVQVYVDDQLVEVKPVPLSTDGAIELEGKPGKQLMIKLKKGTTEKSEPVVLTSDGILPPRIALGFAPTKASGAQPSPSATGLKGIKKDFE
jgi:hypothetical protein